MPEDRWQVGGIEWFSWTFTDREPEPAREEGDSGIYVDVSLQESGPGGQGPEEIIGTLRFPHEGAMRAFVNAYMVGSKVQATVAAREARRQAGGN